MQTWVLRGRRAQQEPWGLQGAWVPRELQGLPEAWVPRELPEVSEQKGVRWWLRGVPAEPVHREPQAWKAWGESLQLQEQRAEPAWRDEKARGRPGRQALRGEQGKEAEEVYS